MSLDGQNIENTYYASVEGLVTEEQIVSGAQAVQLWVEDFYFPQLSNLLSYRGVKATDISSDTGPTYTATGFAGGIGGVAQPSVPSNSPFVIKHLTAQRGRSGRGRSYVPGMPNTSRTGTNEVSSSFANSMLAAFIALDDALVGESQVPCVVSRFHDGLPRVAGLHIPITSHAYTDLVLDSQRRRLPGRGS